MKISYRNYPILEKLNNSSLGNIPLFESDKMFFDFFGRLFIDIWKLHCNNFKKEINVISKAFDSAALKASDKLIDLYNDIIKNDTSDFKINGTFIVGDFVYMIDYEIKRGSEDNELAFFMFDKYGIPLAYYYDSSKNKIYQNGWISSCFDVNKDIDSIHKWIIGKFLFIVIYKMFKSYAQVETKIINPNSKIKEIACKYVNDTNFQITYLNSNWFTNLIKSDAFNVRGHFRLQPKKINDKWTKELIWINEFQKSGYKRKATKLCN